MIYLAMSPERLILTLLFGYCIIGVYHYLIARLTSYKPSKKAKIISIVVFTLIIIYSAFNVGERQANLKRSNFNSHTPEQIEKSEVTPLDSSKVLEEFQLKIKE